MSVQVCFSSGASVNGPRFSVARYSLILSRQAWRQLSLKKPDAAADDAGAVAEELTTTFADELAGDFAEEVLFAVFAEELLATFAEEDAGTAADELAGDFAEEELATFAEEEVADEDGFAAEEDKYLPGACIEEELVRTM